LQSEQLRQQLILLQQELLQINCHADEDQKQQKEKEKELLLQLKDRDTRVESLDNELQG